MNTLARKHPSIFSVILAAITFASVGAIHVPSAFAAGDCVGVSVTPTGQTLAAAVAANPKNTTFCLEAGTYWMTERVVPKSGDKFIGAGSDPAGTILRGDKPISGWTPSGGLYVHTGDVVKVFNTQATCADGGQACMYSDHLFDGTVALHRVLSPCTTTNVTSGNFCIDYTTNTMWLKDDPASMSLTYSYVPAAISNLAGGGLVQHMTIEYFATTGNGDGAITLGSNTVGDDLDIAYNHAAGVRLTSTGPTLSNSVLHDNGQKGLGSFATAGFFTNNTVENNGGLGYTTTSGVGGAKFLNGIGMVVTGNTVLNNVGNGLWFDVDSTGAIVTGNVSSNNTIGADGGGGAGIRIEVSCNITVTGNTLVGNEHGGLTTRDAFNITIGVLGNGNTITDNGFAGVRLSGVGRVVPPLPNCHPLGGVYPETNNVVTGNTITMAASTQTGFDAPVGVIVTGSEFVSNTYSVAGACTDKNWLWSSGSAPKVKVDWATWRVTHLQDVVSTCT